MPIQNIFPKKEREGGREEEREEEKRKREGRREEGKERENKRDGLASKGTCGQA